MCAQSTGTGDDYGYCATTDSSGNITVGGQYGNASSVIFNNKAANHVVIYPSI